MIRGHPTPACSRQAHVGGWSLERSLSAGDVPIPSEKKPVGVSRGTLPGFLHIVARYGENMVY